ncbi:methyltransferase domain-containing protein [Methylomonas sp. AM2-LC]|uniref:class I SAM-dependent methyltransferase n=1 Tax=Methylomonas sp. AM2-LC TaxID=3153301 RepID=UPI0032630DF7
MMQLQAKWDKHYAKQTQYNDNGVSVVLTDHQFLLPRQGKALDLACGTGGNALFLAETGLAVDAWDISAIALNILQSEAQNRLLNINTRQCLITSEILCSERYDVIVISRFLDRALCNAIMAALNVDGLLFYQTFNCSKLDEKGPNNPDYLLASNELLRLFAPLTLIFYQEYARTGNLQCGNRNMAYFIGQKLFSEQN